MKTDTPQKLTLEETLLAFLADVTKAKTLVEVNVAAGVALNRHHRLDLEEAA